MARRHDGWGALRRLRARPRLIVLFGAAAAAGLAFVIVWFQPQALLFDTVVDEGFPPADDQPRAAPGAAIPEGAAGAGSASEPAPRERPRAGAGPGATAPVTEAPGDPENDAEEAGPVELVRGSFASRNRYTVEGTATVYAVDGGRALRLEDFESTNGPDLFVYLTAADHADADEDMAADFVDLGELRGNIGSQNYELPDGVDLARYDTVVVWCRRFAVSFGAADLVEAG